MTAEIVPWTGSRRLLRRLRDVMAGPGSPQQRLDQIATLIARELVAEVCSIYVRRAGMSSSCSRPKDCIRMRCTARA